MMRESCTMRELRDGKYYSALVTVIAFLHLKMNNLRKGIKKYHLKQASSWYPEYRDIKR